MGCVGKIIRFAKREWIILDWASQGCLLMAKEPVDILPWDTNENPFHSWPESEICQWLNEVFFSEAFSDEEQSCIYSGSDNNDFWRFPSKQAGVFLLSVEEVLNYKNIIQKSVLFTRCSKGEDSDWWLRDDRPDDDRDAVLVHGNDVVSDNGRWPFRDDTKFCSHAVRPAVWLDFTYVELFFPGWIKLGERFAYEVLDFGIGTPVNEPSFLKNYSEARDSVIELIEKAEPSVRKDYYMQIFDLLWTFSERNDPSAINKVFSLCPDIERQGYWEWDSPLRAAVETNSVEAIVALFENGIYIDDCGDETSISFALSTGASDDTIRVLLSYGASIEYRDIFPVVVFDKNLELATEMLERSSNIHWNSGIKGLYEAIKSDITGENRWFDCKKVDYNRFIEFLEVYEKTHLPNKPFWSYINDLKLIIESDHGYEKYYDLQNGIYEAIEYFIQNNSKVRCRIFSSPNLSENIISLAASEATSSICIIPFNQLERDNRSTFRDGCSVEYRTLNVNELMIIAEQNHIHEIQLLPNPSEISNYNTNMFGKSYRGLFDKESARVFYDIWKKQVFVLFECEWWAVPHVKVRDGIRKNGYPVLEDRTVLSVIPESGKPYDVNVYKTNDSFVMCWREDSDDFGNYIGVPSRYLFPRSAIDNNCVLVDE